MKKILSYVLSIIVGVFTFIANAFNYITSFTKINGEYVLKDKMTKLTGYKLFDFEVYDGGFSGVMVGILQILLVIVAVCLVAYGVIGLLKEFGALKQECPLCKAVSAKWSFLGLVVYAVLNVLLVIFAIVWCNNSLYEYGSNSTGIKVTFGVFLPLIVSVLSVAGNVVSDRVLK